MRRPSLKFSLAVVLVVLFTISMVESTVGLLLFPLRFLIAPVIVLYLAVGWVRCMVQRAPLPAHLDRFDVMGAARSVWMWARWPQAFRR